MAEKKPKEKVPLTRSEEAHKQLVRLLNKKEQKAKKPEEKPTTWPYKGGPWSPPE